MPEPEGSTDVPVPPGGEQGPELTTEQCWGDFLSHQISLYRAPEDRYLPITSGAVAIDGAERHCALMQDGAVRCLSKTPPGDGSWDGYGELASSILLMDPCTVVWAKEAGTPK